MSDPARRLPARPSLEQLRKQAKEKLVRLVDTQPESTLADAQHALAREYGFESWPRLVHHVESVSSSGRLELFEGLARDFLDGYTGDEPALDRLGAHFADSHDYEWRKNRVRELLNAVQRATPEPTLDDARLVLARQFGFGTWAELAQSMAQPPKGVMSAGLTRVPPFYRIDEKHNTIEPQPPLADRDWDAIFTVMEERGITGISTPAMTDSALERVSRLSFVTRVIVGGAQRLTDTGLMALAGMPQLEELELGGWHCPLTDRGLDVLQHLKALRQFNMGWAQRISDAGVAHLTFCDRLESVNLMGSTTGDGAINVLRGKPGLHRFSTGKLVTDRGIPLLQDFPAFRQSAARDIALGLMTFTPDAHSLLLDGPFSDQGLAGLRGLDGLFGLNFFWHAKAFTSRGLAVLGDLPNLGMVGCDGNMCDDAAMGAFAAVPRLRLLMIQGAVASDDGWATLSRSPSVEYIWGRKCPNLGGRGFAALATLTSLKGLGVSLLNVDEASLSLLPDFPALRQLMPMDVTDDGFRHVGACRDLEDLWCMYCRDTGDVATSHLAGLSRLKSYYAGKTFITDRSLELLSRLDSLEKLEFWEITGITGAGVSALARLPNLRELSIENSPNVARDAVATFPAQVRVRIS